MKLVRALVFLIGLCALSACGMQVQHANLIPRPTLANVGQLTGFSAGGSLQTTGGYNVQSTLGESFGAIQNNTTGGYTLYSNVSGNSASPSN